MKCVLLVATLILAVLHCNAAECTYAGQLQDIKKLAPGSQARENAINRLLKLRLNAACFANLLKGGESLRQKQTQYAAAIKAFETVRTDKQAGSSSGTGGTTSIVSKGTTARVLSMAAEYGALRESVNNQVVTIQGSLDGVPAVMVRKSIFPYCPSDYSKQPACLNQSLFNALRRISYSVSFDTTQNGQTVTATTAGPEQGSAQPVTFTANHHQIASISGRLLLWNARDATSAEFEKQWNDQLKNNTDLSTAAANLLDQLTSLLGDFEDKPEYAKWFQDSRQRLIAADDIDLDVQWGIAAAKLIDLVTAQDPAVMEKAMAFNTALRQFRFEEDTFVESIANKPVLTFEYNNNRPVNQDSTSTFRLIFDKGLSKWSIAANGAVEIYDSKPSQAVPDARRLRDAQVGIQFDRSLGSLALLGGTAVSAAYYFQYQNSPAIINVTPGIPLQGITFVGLPATATEAFSQKGNLHIAQLKLVLGQTSVRFPLAVSYSNRTELISKPSWRAQVGISYDFDALFAK